MKSSEYINEQRREYSLYVLTSRAIPAVSDGLKAAARRVLWVARDGKKYKSATLAGATLPIHPHAPPESTINTLAAPQGNNIPLFHGVGAFGTHLNPTAYGASRYTSIVISQFTKDVIFRDIEIIPMKENYDSTQMEPVHFLPLVPVVLLNPTEGIAVGFATTILPRELNDILSAQIRYLQKKKIEDVLPSFSPTDNVAIEWEEDKNGKIRWTFEGNYSKVNSTTLNVSKLPYGSSHSKYIDFLMKLEENDVISDFIDSSKNKIDIEIKFKRGVIEGTKRAKMKKLLNLINSVTENMNVLNFDGERVWSATFVDIVKGFCDWRLGYYVHRFERLSKLLNDDIQKYKDILVAIKQNVGGMAKKIQSRSELKLFIEEIKIVNIDYIADLPIYRFTEEEKNKIEKKLADANSLLNEYKQLLNSEPDRRKLYIKELKEIQRNHEKGNYV